MTSIEDILGEVGKKLRICPGAIFHGPMEGVNHGKFYIIVGISGDNICACSVVINSKINPFIANRPKLLELQIEISKDDYTFLDHRSYINCADPIRGKAEIFQLEQFTYKAQLKDEHLTLVVRNIIESGLLTQEEIELYFNL